MAPHHEGRKLSGHEQRAFDEIVRHLVMEETQPTRPERQPRRGWAPWRRRRGLENEPQSQPQSEPQSEPHEGDC